MITRTRSIALAVGALAALAAAAPAAAEEVESTRTTGGTEFAAPVQGFSTTLALPTFTFSMNGEVHDSRSYVPESMDVGLAGGWLIVAVEGAGSSPTASTTACADGEQGTSLSVYRASPGSSFTVFYDPGTRTDATPRQQLTPPIGTTEGSRPTNASANLCQGI